MENEQIEMILMDVEERAEKSVSVLKADYAVIRAGRANPHILDKVLVDYYGTPSPINQVATYRFRTRAVSSSPLGTLPCLKL